MKPAPIAWHWFDLSGQEPSSDNPPYEADQKRIINFMALLSMTIETVPEVVAGTDIIVSLITRDDRITRIATFGRAQGPQALVVLRSEPGQVVDPDILLNAERSLGRPIPKEAQTALSSVLPVAVVVVRDAVMFDDRTLVSAIADFVSAFANSIGKAAGAALQTMVNMQGERDDIWRQMGLTEAEQKFAFKLSQVLEDESVKFFEREGKPKGIRLIAVQGAVAGLAGMMGVWTGLNTPQT